MTRRSALKALLEHDAGTPPAPLGAPVLGPAGPRGSGAVRAMGLEIARLMGDGATAKIVEIDADLIEPSPVRDRLDEGEADALAPLVESIRAHGQHVPVLVRREAGEGERYRIAFGHRRWAACRALGRPVRAVVADLSDEAMLVAQGQENAERRDLSFIERAGFAAELEGRGHSRRMIGEALSCDKSEVSRLLAVCRSVPIDLVVAIGRAPKAGRPRWLALGRALEGSGALERARVLVAADGFARLPSDERFADVLAAATDAPSRRMALRRAVHAAGPDGPERLATLTGERLVIAPAYGPAFADWLADRLPALAAEWREGR